MTTLFIIGWLALGFLANLFLYWYGLDEDFVIEDRLDFLNFIATLIGGLVSFITVLFLIDYGIKFKFPFKIRIKKPKLWTRKQKREETI